MHTTAHRTFSLHYVLDLLLQNQIISSEQYRDIEIKEQQQVARILKEKFGGVDQAEQARYKVSPIELVASFELTSPSNVAITEDIICKLVAHDAGLSFEKVDPLKLDMKLITTTFSRPFALRHVALPLEMNESTMVIAVENPYNMELRDELSRHIDSKVVLKVATKTDIVKAIVEVYGFNKSVQAAARDMRHRDDPGQKIQNLEQLIHLKQSDKIEANDQHIVNAVEFILNYAFDQRASDIHIEPRREHSQVRLRIDGVLHDTHTFPANVHPAFVSRIKMLSRLDIAEKRRPQDGRIKTRMGEKEIELRVSTMPVAFGEKVVIRIFDPEVLQQELDDLGYYPEELATFRQWIHKPNGIILITGPTGSGKTTTLYTTLLELADPEINIVSVEDPIEMVTDRFNQVGVQNKIGVTFAAALRTILRQDPDIIMVGEIRDLETAEMAIQASLTGHLVFSTLHTNETASAITRILELGVEPYLVKTSLIGVIAQRLIRKVCSQCKQEVQLSHEQLQAINLSYSKHMKTYHGQGCQHCRGTGYYGRTGVYEVLDVNEPIQHLIQNHVDVKDIQRKSRELGMMTLRECAVKKLLDGETSFQEVIRVTGLQ